jgi:DNA primase
VIARETIDEVRQRANLLEVAARYTTLHRAGREYRGLSPFAEEKTPSFYINPEKNVFTCFSTQESGDLFAFVQKMENLGFQEAVESLAERFGVEIRYERGGPSRGEVSLRRQLFEIHAHAAEFFASSFRSPAGASMRGYWEESRGFSRELAESLRIGRAPQDGEALASFLRKKGFGDRELEACGLFYERRHPQAPLRCRFRGRLMIPIRDVQERVIAFTARATEETPEDDPSREAKYINSPETPLFRKGSVVFGLERARSAVRDGRRFLLVEGQLDVLRCWENGLDEAVALQGTASGEEQFRLLQRYGNGVDVLLDGDEAGGRAAFRMIPTALRLGLDLRLAALPTGTDPDDWLRREGPEGLREVRGQALGPVAFALRRLAPRPGDLGVQDRAAVLAEIFALLTEVSSAVAREDYLGEVADYLRIDPGALREDFRRSTPSPAGPPRPPASQPAPEGSTLLLTENEEVLLFFALRDGELRQVFSDVIDFDWLTKEKVAAKLLRRVLVEMREGTFSGSEEFHGECDEEEERQLVARLLRPTEEPPEPEIVADQALRELVRRFASEEISSLVTQMNGFAADDPALRELQSRRRQLRQLMDQPPRLLLS